MRNIQKIINESKVNSKVQFNKDVLDDAHYFRGEIERVLIRIINEKRKDATIRIFQENGRRDDHLNKLFAIGLENGVSIERQLDRIFDNEYCIAINFLTSWSVHLCDYFRDEFMTYWLDAYGATLNGVDVYAFIGKYSATPFGLHEDDEHSFLFGLGPYEKDVHIVDNCSINKLSLPIFELESIEGISTKYHLGTGDLIFIPQFEYHILGSPQYTVMLGVAPYPMTQKTFFDKASRRLERLFDLDDSNNQYGNDLDIMNNLVSKIDEIGKFYSESIGDCLAAESVCIRSSKYLIGTPAFKIQKNDNNKAFVCKHKIEYLNSTVLSRCFIFANGKEIVIKNREFAEKLLSIVNSGRVFSVESLEEMLSVNNNTHFFIQFIAALLESGSIKYA